MKKQLALAELLGLEVFEYNGEYYVGDEQDFLSETIDSTDEEIAEWLEEYYAKLEDEIIEDGDELSYGRETYLVLTEDEAEAAVEEAIEDYIENVVMDEIPKAYQYYFDKDAYKRDVEMDGRGVWLARYDHNEEEIQINGEWYFIYRTN